MPTAIDFRPHTLAGDSTRFRAGACRKSDRLYLRLVALEQLPVSVDKATMVQVSTPQRP